MGQFVSAKLDTRPLERRLRVLKKSTGRRALARALNVGLAGLVAESKAEAKKATTLKAGRVNQAFRKQRARVGRGHAELGIGTQPVPLIHFRARPMKRGGVSFQVKRQGGRQRLKHAFVATMPSGHEGVFERNLKKQIPRRAPGYHGLRISEKHSTGVGVHLGRPKVKRRIMDEGKRRFIKELDRQIDLALSK